ncbi:MAG: sterol desaturase family protein [Myxococcales bacterium]|nr:sterol desaturase family protein [Myxococcales bacterium]
MDTTKPTPQDSPEPAYPVSYVIFPMVLSIGLFCTAYFSGRVDNPMSAAIAVSLSSMALIALLERIIPYRRDWNQARGDVATDVWHTLLNQILLSRGLNIAWTFLLLGAAAQLSTRAGGSLWPHHWPAFAELVLMLVVAEFGRYWCHRLSHRNKWLWRLHAVHHSPSRLYFLNAGRVHALEKVLYIIPEVVPFVLLGTNVECLALYGTFNSIQGLFQHANINVRLGPLNYFFSMSELHRWHHSKIVEESDHNFGNNLSVWDVVFRTWYLPKDRHVGPLGLRADGYPESFGGQLAAPFQARDISQVEPKPGATP